MAYGFGGLPLPTLNAFDVDPSLEEARRRLAQTGALPAPQPGIASVFPSAPALPMSDARTPQDEAPPAAGLPSLVGAPAPGGAGLGFPRPAPAPASSMQAPKADKPAPGAVPIASANPPVGVPTMSGPPPQAPAAAVPAAPQDESGFSFKNFRDNGGMDLLGSIGMGLLSSPNWGSGVASGLAYADQRQSRRAAGEVAKAELDLRKVKLAQEQRQLTGNATFVKSKVPGISDEQAIALGSNSGFMTELAKGALPPTELFRQYTDDDGNRWSRNLRTGQESVALQAKDDKSVRTLTDPAERAKYGIDAKDTRVAQLDANGSLSFPGAAGQTINLGGEKAQDATVGKGYGEYQLDLATKGRNASLTLNTLALMEQAARNDRFYSGSGAEWVKRANQALVALGVKDANYTKPTEVFDALSNKVVLDGLGGSLGPGISNTDRDYIGRTAPTIERTKEGNLELIGIARTLAQRQQQVAKLARDYAGAHGGRLDAGFDQTLDEFATANPLFPAAKASSTKVSDGTTGANGPGGLAAPKTQAEFDALPTGSLYLDPNDGRKYRK